jgi:hypothetical protein
MMAAGDGPDTRPHMGLEGAKRTSSSKACKAQVPSVLAWVLGSQPLPAAPLNKVPARPASLSAGSA